MKFVDYNKLDKTIQALSELREEIKQDKRIKMDNALALVVTRAELLKNLVDSESTPPYASLLDRSRSLAEAFKQYNTSLRCDDIQGNPINLTQKPEIA